MTCVNCENRIERKLGGLPGVLDAKASYSAGTATITFDPARVRRSEIEQAIASLDYRVVRAEQGSKKPSAALTAAGAALLLTALFALLRQFGVLDVFNMFPQAETGTGYGMLFVIGLLTSLHCVAMCGGINLSQCVRKDGAEGSAKSANLRPSLLYNLGRVASYTVTGGIVGAVGSVVGFSGVARGVVQLVAGVFMVIMGLNLLNVFPWLRKLSPRMPKRFARKIGAEKRGNGPFYVGLLNGLMPCGPLQAMQIYALSTGSALHGALSMLLFSLGTVPLMFSLGALSAFLTKKFTRAMTVVSAALVVVLGVSMFQSGLGLSGIAAPSFPLPRAAQTAAPAQAAEAVQEITSGMTARAYEPITVRAGIPVRWTLRADMSDLNGCNGSIVIPSLHIEKKLTVGDNVIEFTPAKSGIIPFSCWMGMIQSSIVVVDPGEASAG